MTGPTLNGTPIGELAAADCVLDSWDAPEEVSE
jgi:hypothetical protein